MDASVLSNGRDEPSPGRPLLEVTNMSKTFRVNGASLPVLERISFRARRGELICIFGRSGCGKSTLLKILAGFVPPTSGSLLLEGEEIKGPGADRCIVFQEDALFPWLTVAENIAFGLKGRGMSKAALNREVQHFLSFVGLSDFGDYLPREISGGMRQRVALARVLILKPKLLLMDEPFGALDYQTREEMQELLLLLWKQLAITIVFVTHDAGEALLLADRILIMGMNPGGIEKEMHVEIDRPRVRDEKAFLSMMHQLHELLRPDGTALRQSSIPLT